ncbi:MAG: hypothetical protein E7Z76_00440 [Methanobrevibacter sp.]|nr:hypothetical protein [Methanobrevibacter sp.]
MNNLTLDTSSDRVNDDILNDIELEGTFSDLADEISDSSTVNLSKDYVFDSELDSNYTNGIVIDKQIVINGNGHLINGKNVARIFNISASGVILNNITFINAFNSNFGGAVYNSGNGLIILNSFFIGNVATNGGGAIYSNATNTHILNNTFNNNKATSSLSKGGAVFLDTNSYNSLVNNSFFDSNSACRYGGALEIYAKALVSNSLFSNNIISGNECNGGALSFMYADGIRIIKCVFVSNKGIGANSYGGAINTASNSEIDACNFTFNYAFRAGAIRVNNGILNCSNCNFYENNATYGGAIHIASSGATFKNNYFYKNKGHSSTGYGGAVNVYTGIINCLFDNCTFESNQAANAGAIHAAKNTNNFKILNSKFIENNAYVDAGAVILQGFGSSVINSTFIKNAANKNSGFGGAINLIQGSSNTLIDNCSFLNNQVNVGGAIFINPNVNNVVIQNAKFIENYVLYYAGAIAWQGSNGRLINSTFIKNTANKDNAGAIEFNGGGKTNTIINCTFLSNSAAYGGALRSINSFSNLKVYNSTFKYNSAKSDGGAISMHGANSEIHNCIFISNTVSKRGGGIDTTSSKSVIENCTFINNTASQWGGGIRFSGENSKILNSTFINNVAKLQGGGAVSIGGYATNAYVDNIVVINCSAKYQGSGVMSFVTGTTIVNSIFKNNFNTANDYGGAVAFSNKNAKLINSTFSNNTNYDGGAVLIYDACNNAVIENCIFNNNVAKVSGGAIRSSKSSNKVTIKNSTFINNRAQNYGGSLSINGYSSIISNCTFINSSATYGGAMFLSNNCILNNSNLINNFANIYGGGVYASNNVQILLSTFNNNSALSSGGSIYSINSNLLISGSNFFNSSSNVGGAIYLTEGSKNVIIGCNFKDNIAKTIGGAIYFNTPDSSINESNFNNNKANSYGGAIYANAKSTIYNSNFTSNLVSIHGGAIYVASANINILKGFYSNNSATYGGAIYISSQHVLLNESKFISNSATYGGAIYWESIYGRLIHASFSNNNATYGGAAYLNCENINVTYSTFKKNKAKTQGGAIYAFKGALFNSSNFIENEAFSGGALYLYGDNSVVSLSNFTSNIADYGAGFYTVSSIDLSKSNFTSNDASILGGAGYSFVFISRTSGDNIFTYWDETYQIDNLYTSFVKLLNDTIFTGQNITLEYNSPDYFGNISLLINNKTFPAIKLGDGIHFIGDVDNLTEGVYDHIFAIYHSDDEFNNSYALVSLTVKRLPISVSLIDNVTDIGGSVRVKVNRTDAKGNITITFDGGYAYTGEISDNGIAIIKLDDNIPFGDYNVTLDYGGDFKYDITRNISSIHINKVILTPSLQYNWTYYAGEVTIILPIDATSGTVSFTIGGKKFSNSVSGGSVSFNLDETINPNYYDSVLIEFSGNQKYNATKNVSSFTVSKFPVGIDIDINRTMVKDNLGFILYSEEANYNIEGIISFIIGGKTFSSSLSVLSAWSTASINVGNLPGGVYENITVLYTCSNKYYLNSARNFTFELIKYDSEVKYGGESDVEVNKTLKFVLDSKDATGNVSFVIDGKTYNATLNNGIANIDINGLPKGVYNNILVVYSGDDFYNPSQTIFSFKVKEHPKINLTINDIIYGQNTTLKVNITTNDVTGRVIVYANNTKRYDGIINSQIFDITLSGLSQGKYIINLTYGGDNKHFSTSESINLVVYRANSTININDIVNGIYNTTDSVVSFDIENRTSVSIIVVNESGIIVYENNTFTLNQFSTQILNAGIYNITISNAQSRNYNAFNTTVSFKIIKALSKVNITEIVNGTYNTTNVEIKFDVVNRTVVSIIIKNQFGNTVYENNDYKLSEFIIGNLTAGSYNITISNAFNNNYNASNITKIFKVIKSSSKVTIINVTNGIYNTTQSIVSFAVINRTTISILVYKNGTNSCVFNNTNFEGNIFSIGNLSAGIYNITIYNNGSLNYNSSQIWRIFEVQKAPSLVNINGIISGIYNTTNATVKFDITNETAVKIIVYKNGTDVCVFNSTNFTKNEFSIGNLTAGVYNITITNIENDNYKYSINSSLFTIFKANSKVEITNIVNATFNTTNIEISMSIINKTSVDIVITQGDNIIYIFNNFQENIFSIRNLTAGVYNVTIRNNVGENFNSSMVNASFTVFKANSFIDIVRVINSTYKINSTIVTVDVVNKTSIYYIVKSIDGVEVLAVNNSDINIVISNLAVGKYNISVINNEDVNFLSSNCSALFNIEKSYSKVNITSVIDGRFNTRNVTVSFNVIASTIINVIVRDDEGNIVYNKTDFRNEVFSISSLPVGVYNITILNIETDDAYASNDSALFSVFVQTTVLATDLNRGYNSSYDYMAMFTDEFGNKLNNTNVTVIVDNKTYILITDANGVAYLNSTALNIGVHEIQLINPVSNETKFQKINIVERLQENKDIVMDFCDGTFYSVRAYGDDGQPIAGVTVTISVNGISYDVVTNKEGYALLKIRLNPKTYIITAEWKDYKINKIVVKQTLKANSVKIKKSSKKFKYSAILKWSNKKPIIGKIITFKFKGKIYKSKTNKKGIAKITFNKKLLNKLKVGKKYNINITYSHVDNGYTSVNSLVKKVKVVV